MGRFSLAIAVALALACGSESRARRRRPRPARAGSNRARAGSRPTSPGYDVSVECAELRVPERWDAPDSAREVRIPVVTLRAGGKARWATLIPGGGGPGGGVGLESDDAATTVGNHASIAADSGGDVVIVDTRGAGSPSPRSAARDRDATLRWLHTSPRSRRRRRSGRRGAALPKRLAESRGRGGRLRRALGDRDLEALRGALGYERWNLFGTSYAGEIALQYAHAVPARSARSCSIHRACPSARSCRRRGSRTCSKRCSRAAPPTRTARATFPDPGAALDRLLKRFARAPLAPHRLRSRWPRPVRSRSRRCGCSILIFDAMYDTKRAHEIPIMLTAADRGSYDWLHEFAREYVWTLLDPRFSPALLDAVPCRESIPFGDLARAEREARANPWARAFVGVERVTTAVCRAWNVGRAQPPAVAFDGPALVLAGQLDPVIALPDVERPRAAFTRS
jgi:pimeloyl-ACP methyl ester carboxylesterase